jgi:hypothetical protein
MSLVALPGNQLRPAATGSGAPAELGDLRAGQILTAGSLLDPASPRLAVRLVAACPAARQPADLGLAQVAQLRGPLDRDAVLEQQPKRRSDRSIRPSHSLLGVGSHLLLHEHLAAAVSILLSGPPGRGPAPPAAAEPSPALPASGSPSQ